MVILDPTPPVCVSVIKKDNMVIECLKSNMDHVENILSSENVGDKDNNGAEVDIHAVDLSDFYSNIEEQL